MLEIVELGPGVVGYRADGRIEREDVERAFAELDRRLAEHGQARVYGEVVSITGISLEALWRDVQLGVGHLRSIGRIPRAALVTDVPWVRGAGVVENRVFSGIDLRVFPLSEAAQARAWLLA